MEHIDWLFGFTLPYVNFFIFVGLAIYFFRKPAREAAKKKRETFDKLVAESRAVREAAEAKLAELKQREAGLDREIAEIRAISKDSAESEAQKLIADGDRLAAHLRIEAKRIAEAAVEKARGELRQEIVDSVRASVAKKLKSELNPDAQLKLVRGKIADLGKLETHGG